MTEHNPVAPTWICAGCGTDWPCPSRRKELRAEFHHSTYSLRLYLGHFFAPMAEDLRHIPAGWLHNRLIAWIGEPHNPTPTTAVDILIKSYQLAKTHDPTSSGRCPVCDDPTDCWVRLDPNGPGFLIPVP